jgi:hypothetical protein
VIDQFADNARGAADMGGMLVFCAIAPSVQNTVICAGHDHALGYACGIKDCRPALVFGSWKYTVN